MAQPRLWIEEIYDALIDLGGKGSLKSIYDQIYTRNKMDLNHKSWHATVRRTIEQHSSDTKSFYGINHPNDDDFFYAPKGLNAGYWAIREKYLYSEKDSKKPINEKPSELQPYVKLTEKDSILEIVKEDIQSLQIEESSIDEELFKESYKEGKFSSTLINKHERNPKLRAVSLKIHGTRCQICNFSFAETYGPHGENFIEVHHLNPVSQYTGEVEVNPSTDMAVICANCHRMIHRKPKNPLSIEELREIVNAHRKPEI